MTIDKAKEFIQTQINLGGGYNRNSAKVILADIQREHGQGAVDQLIREMDLETHFGFKPGDAITI